MKTHFEITSNMTFQTLDAAHSSAAILMWVLIQIPGNYMLIGLILYEKYGGDPLKRRIIDQLFSLVYATTIFRNLSVVNIFMLKVLGVGNVGLLLATFLTTVRSAGVVIIVMVIIETSVLRYLIEFVWKRVPPINDSFFAFFLSLFNIIVGTLISLARYGTGENLDLASRLQGIPEAMIQQPSLQFKIPVIMIILAFGSVLLLFLRRVIAKIRNRCKRSQILPVIEIPAAHNFSFNNSIYNPEIMNHAIVAILAIIIIVPSIPTIYFYLYLNNSGRPDYNQNILLVDLWPHFILSVIVPSVIISSNASLRKFVKSLPYTHNF